RPLPAADRDAFADFVEQQQPLGLAAFLRAVALLAALVAGDGLARDQTVAVRTHEEFAGLLLELVERLLQQVFAFARVRRDVLLFGAQEQDFDDRHQQAAAALGAAQHRTALRREYLQLLLAQGRVARLLQR